MTTKKQKAKVISKNFLCPKCKEGKAYTYFDFEVNLHRWNCPACGSEGNLRDLAFKAP